MLAADTPAAEDRVQTVLVADIPAAVGDTLTVLESGHMLAVAGREAVVDCYSSPDQEYSLVVWVVLRAAHIQDNMEHSARSDRSVVGNSLMISFVPELSGG